MKPAVFVGVASAMLCGAAVGTGAEQEAAAPRGLAVLWVGERDAKLLDGVLLHLKESFRCPVRVLPGRPVLAESPSSQAEALAKLLTGRDLCLLALINVPQEVTFVQAVFPSSRVAMLNVSRLERDEDGAQADAVRRTRRVKKESVRLLGLMLGLRDCPNPLCAMYQSRNDMELDRKGDNLCPPCYVRAQALLRAAGVPEVDPHPAAAPPASGVSTGAAPARAGS